MCGLADTVPAYRRTPLLGRLLPVSGRSPAVSCLCEADLPPFSDQRPAGHLYSMQINLAFLILRLVCDMLVPR